MSSRAACAGVRESGTTNEMGDQPESSLDHVNDQVVENISTMVGEVSTGPLSSVNDESHPQSDSQISNLGIKDESVTQTSIITDTSEQLQVKDNIDTGELCDYKSQGSPRCKLLADQCEPLVEDMEITVSSKMESLGFREGSLESQVNPNFVAGNDAVSAQSHVPLQDEEQLTSEDSDDSSSSEDSSSDSDSDSSSSSSTSSSSGPLASVLGEEDDGDDKNTVPVKTQGEILIEELPVVEDVVVVLPEDAEIQPIGVVSRIIDKLVIIEALKDTPPLNEDSIIFNRERQSAGKVFEIFGPVFQPYYVLRFNSVEHITEKGLKLHDTVFFAPLLKDFTDYVFTEQLKMNKGSDASWKNDQEPPPEALDFSDDEKEKAAKQKKKKPQGKRQRWPEQHEDDDNSSAHSKQQTETRRGGGGGGGYRGSGFKHQPPGGFHNQCFSHCNPTMMTWAPHRHVPPHNNRMVVENRPVIGPPPFPGHFQPHLPYMPPFPYPPVHGHMPMPWLKIQTGEVAMWFCLASLTPRLMSFGDNMIISASVLFSNSDD
ncbi:H/ACA ribonucleoprotein complex non-core subunit NAF1 [Arapaima gigas]